ncbi:hypothetical protein D6821_00265 [Candidatus Parcubacteria bacterium]|nr:MAG: hypothetical protein D6821_00265 [Candidatus Parcubacteria bacterium]
MLNDKKKKLGLLAAVIFLVLIACSWWYWRHMKPTSLPVDNQSTTKLDWDQTSFSRLTFFNTQPLRGSLLIPEHWEGKFRFREEGRRAVFYYLEKGKEVGKIFYLRLYLPEEKVAEGEEVIFVSPQQYRVTVRWFSAPKSVFSLKDFQQLSQEAKEVVSLFKANIK